MDESVTNLLAKINDGNKDAEAELMRIVYRDLRRQAARFMNRERKSHTLQPTALVHEAYLRLLGQQERNWQNRAHFLAMSAQLMRRILVDHARGKRAVKRGGLDHRVDLDEALLAAERQSIDLIALDEALQRLAAVDERQSRIVELRFFGGLSEEEIALVLKISTRTVKRDWLMARAWLYGNLRDPGGAAPVGAPVRTGPPRDNGRAKAAVS